MSDVKEQTKKVKGRNGHKKAHSLANAGARVTGGQDTIHGILQGIGEE